MELPIHYRHSLYSLTSFSSYKSMHLAHYEFSRMQPYSSRRHGGDGMQDQRASGPRHSPFSQFLCTEGLRSVTVHILWKTIMSNSCGSLAIFLCRARGKYFPHHKECQGTQTMPRVNNNFIGFYRSPEHQK